MRPGVGGFQGLRWHATLTALLVSAQASAGAIRDCELRTHAAFPGYVFAAGSEARAAKPERPGQARSRARGDFDGDGRMDTALLLRPASATGKYAIAVCLSSKPAVRPELIREAYTPGPITTTPKGRKYLDFDSNVERRYEHDGIGSYCCECCGATYIYRKGKFVEVVDSD